MKGSCQLKNFLRKEGRAMGLSAINGFSIGKMGILKSLMLAYKVCTTFPHTNQSLSSVFSLGLKDHS